MVTAKTGKQRGRPKGSINRNTREIKAYAQQYGTEVIEFFMGIVRDQEADLRVCVEAGHEVLDRAYGKAAQPHRQSANVGTYDLNKLTDDQLRSAYEILKLAAPDHVLGDTD